MKEELSRFGKAVLAEKGKLFEAWKAQRHLPDDSWRAFESEHADVVRHGRAYIAKPEDELDFKAPQLEIRIHRREHFDLDALVAELESLAEPRSPGQQRELLEKERLPEKLKLLREIYEKPSVRDKPAELPRVGRVRVQLPSEREPGINFLYGREAIGWVHKPATRGSAHRITVDPEHPLAEPLLRYLLSKRFVKA
jgi:hypothetical protein